MRDWAWMVWPSIAWLIGVTACSSEDSSVASADGAGGSGAIAAGGSGGNAGASGSSPSSCMQSRNVSSGDPACDTGKGGPMRQVPLQGGGMMCIDKTEVTVGQYQMFVASGQLPQLPSTDPAYSRCAAITDHRPTCQTEPCQGSSCDLPQTCIDQCDAKAYCAWVGKRLCGAVGSVPLGLSDVDDPAKNQWMNACTASGANQWPYGSEYSSHACNTSDQMPACGGPAVTSSYASCQAAAPYDQVFDLSGNVSEWVDASQEGAGWPELRCIIMGGSYVHYWGDVGCSGATLEWPCDAHHPEFGFRCCSL